MMRARNGYSSNFGCGVSGEISGSWLCKNAYLKDIRIITLAQVAARGRVAEV